MTMERTRYESVRTMYTVPRTACAPNLSYTSVRSCVDEPAVLRAIELNGVPSHSPENSLVHFDSKTTQHFSKTTSGEFVCKKKGPYTVSLNAHQTSPGRGWLNFKVMYRPGENRADVRLLGISTHTYGLTASALTYHWLSEGSKLWVEVNGSGSTRFECELNITCAKSPF